MGKTDSVSDVQCVMGMSSVMGALVQDGKIFSVGDEVKVVKSRNCYEKSKVISCTAAKSHMIVSLSDSALIFHNVTETRIVKSCYLGHLCVFLQQR